MSSKAAIDIIIPSFNGKHLLQKNLPLVLKNTTNLGKIIVVDNGSTDGTADWIKKNYPSILVLVNSKNLGYTIPINQGVTLSNSEFFILLNNDVAPQQDYLVGPLKLIKDSKVFGVSFCEKQSSWPKFVWEKGKFQFTEGDDKNNLSYSAWASGGSAIFSRKAWNQLGGLDEIYAPWYWEDIDIGYRAWKTGYKIYWDPSSVVSHEHESTSKNLNPSFVNTIKQRNELLFNWLNTKDFQKKISHFFFLLLHSLKHPGYLRIVVLALWRLVSHKHLKRSFILKDSEALLKISKKI